MYARTQSFHRHRPSSTAPNPSPLSPQDDLSGLDMAELQKMMGGMGGGGAGGPPGDDAGGDPGGMPPGMDMEALMKMMGGGTGGMGGMGGMEGMMGGMGGMGGPPQGPPPDMGEVDGGSGDTKWKWEMKDDEIIVRIEMQKPATKKDLKVSFGATTLKVEVFGETIIDGTLAGTVHGDESTWCLVEQGTELQILLSANSSERWPSLLKDSD